jgi:hypothetical protein
MTATSGEVQIDPKVLGVDLDEPQSLGFLRDVSAKKTCGFLAGYMIDGSFENAFVYTKLELLESDDYIQIVRTAIDKTCEKKGINNKSEETSFMGIMKPDRAQREIDTIEAKANKS